MTISVIISRLAQQCVLSLLLLMPASQLDFCEETKLYPQIERLFDNYLSSLIIEYFFRFMDDGFSPWPDDADINIFIILLNDLHPSIKFTLEAATKSVTDGVVTQMLNFLDITIILHETGHIEIYIFL